jgi:hypothetical protein
VVISGYKWFPTRYFPYKNHYPKKRELKATQINMEFNTKITKERELIKVFHPSTCKLIMEKERGIVKVHLKNHEFLTKNKRPTHKGNSKKKFKKIKNCMMRPTRLHEINKSLHVHAMHAAGSFSSA